MRPAAAIESALDAFTAVPEAPAAAQQLIGLAEEVLENWIAARGEAPTTGTSEGFRLLALHRQGARGVPSFNACRETCREIAYHYNLLCGEPDHALSARRQQMMAMLTRHLALFVSGKMQAEGLGEFCCASRPLRQESTQ
ncbi:MAG: hypothetical protein ACM36B_10615 [Bacteroidota bacterium]